MGSFTIWQFHDEIGLNEAIFVWWGNVILAQDIGYEWKKGGVGVGTTRREHTAMAKKHPPSLFMR